MKTEQFEHNTTVHGVQPLSRHLTPLRVEQAEKTNALRSLQRAARRCEKHLGASAAAALLAEAAAPAAPADDRPAFNYETDWAGPALSDHRGYIDATGFDAFDFALSIVGRLGRPEAPRDQWESPFLAIGKGPDLRWFAQIEGEKRGRVGAVARSHVEGAVMDMLGRHSLPAKRVCRDSGGRLPGVWCAGRVDVTASLLKAIVAEIAQLPCVGFDSLQEAEAAGAVRLVKGGAR